MQSNPSIEIEGTQDITTDEWVYGLFFALLIFVVVTLYFYLKQRNKKPVKAYEIKHLLHKHFIYYRYLSQKNKMVFEARVFRFIQEKEFIPRNFREVTSKMKILIAATAVQITFGLPDITLRHFKRIMTACIFRLLFKLCGED